MRSCLRLLEVVVSGLRLFQEGMARDFDSQPYIAIDERYVVVTLAQTSEEPKQ